MHSTHSSVGNINAKRNKTLSRGWMDEGFGKQHTLSVDMTEGTERGRQCGGGKQNL